MLCGAQWYTQILLVPFLSNIAVPEKIYYFIPLC